MSGAGDVQAVVFGLGEEVFALPVGIVREIIDHRDAFRIPHGPDWLMGLTEVRDEAVPTVDLRRRLGLDPAPLTPMTRILIVEAVLADRRLTLGLMVDRVLDVASFAAAAIEPTPDIGVRWDARYIRGVVRTGKGFVVLLDLAGIFHGGDDAAVLAAAPVAAAA
ncbi:chemotaxis protein CheW [Sphingomonas mollis]|uniref:Chemotaxis protein CheW n=1 Tax=Sphingomonas mollis TaxID=2795726 RepID=A0ABS0XQM8_9SPHN|nr:chemotaxis protein CheW [Sphingomonas sp. BT553]MBJ6122353.1 chemotaxis protein CheW [Sphingomonas sp. BT553]